MRAGDWPEPSPALAPRQCSAGRAWVHEGYRMRFGGRGGALHEVAADAPIMTDIEHAPGEAARLHAEGVSFFGGRAGAWLASAVDAPLFIWRSPSGGVSSWRGPAGDWDLMQDPAHAQLAFASRGSGARVRFGASTGTLRVAAGRIEWQRDGEGLLTAIFARDAADLTRTMDLLDRRGLAGLAAQRARHAEHLVRGGAAVMTDAAPALAEAFEWAKLRADARLGSLVHGAGEPDAQQADAALLADALRAAGLAELPRLLERRHSAGPGTGGASPREAGRGFDDFAPAEVTSTLADDLAAGTAGPVEAARILTGTIRGAWGAIADESRGRVVLRPDPARLGTRAALSRLRAGGTVIDLRLRRQGDVVSLSVRRGAGPSVDVACSIRGVASGELLLDEEPLGGETALFELSGAHGVQARLRHGPELSSASS